MRFPGLILVSVSLLILSACGASDGDDAGSPSSTNESTSSQDGEPSTTETSDAETATTEGLEEAFTTYTKAFLQAKADKAYELVSQRCQEATDRKGFADASEQLTETYGKDFKLTITGSDLDGDRGKVEATYGDPVLNQLLTTDKYDWLYDTGRWLLDGCEA